MALQSQVDTEKAVAVAGDLAVPENAQYYPVNLLAGRAGVEVGKFVQISSGGVAVNATTAPIRIAQRNLSYPDYQVTGSGSLVVPEGGAIQTVANGDVYVTATDSATVGAKVYLNAGAIVTTSASGAVDTGWTVATPATSGGIMLICKH
jgi:hypothetical protein